MSNIAIAFKHEITRLARKEVRNQIRSLHKTSARLRKDAAALKRQNKKLQAELARLARQLGKGSAVPPAEAAAPNPRFSVRSVKSQRKRLGISAADFGKLIGVTAHTVYAWEHGRVKPGRTKLAGLADIRKLGKTAVKERLAQSRRSAPKPKPANR